MVRPYRQQQLNKVHIVLFLACFLLLPIQESAIAEGNSILSGRVLDVEQRPVNGVEVYVYDDDNIRRPADFISPPTDKNGEFTLTVPPGRYWVVARLRSSGQQYGPLLAGDKHSGPPLEIDIQPGEHLEEEFVVADLKETSLLTVKVNSSFIKVEGVLQTKEGQPVENGYAFANRQPVAKKIPDYIGPWTTEDGKFTLFLPEGTYYFGLAHEFPPGAKNVPTQEVSVDSTTKSIYIKK